MRAAGRALALALLAALPLSAVAGMNVSLTGGPTNVLPGHAFTLILRVQNTDPGYALSAVSPWLGVQANGFGPQLITGPSPASQGIAPTSFADFTWTYSGASCGDVVFSAGAAGTDSGSAAPIASAASNLLQVFMICTPTPTPTASPVHSPTPTATPTQWYATATPPPSKANPYIPGNLYHPLKGGFLHLRYDAPLEGPMQVDLYDRLGNRVRHFERQVLPGSYTELWDGRSDDGLLVPAGIYAAHFKGQGLSRVVKFAVIK